MYQDMPSMKATVNVRDDIPTAEDQAEFERQLELMISEHKSYPSIVAWVLYNEGWGQIKLAYQPEIELFERVRKLDPTRLIDATSGWYDHGAGDFSVCLASPGDVQSLIAVRTTTTIRNRNAARRSTQTHPHRMTQTGSASRESLVESDMFRPTRGLHPSRDMMLQIPADSPTHSLWPVQGAKDSINQTYELGADLAAYNYRSRVLLGLLRDQVALYACSGAVWTQTTDVEGEVNGLVSYDRRVVRVNETQWREDIQALHRAAEARA